ncbi:unnamed protein product [Malus baccata var. baccata]
MLRLRSLILRVVQRHTAASSSTSPCSTGQHSFTTGSPCPTWTNPPRRSTQAPSFNVSMGHVFPGGGGHGVPGLGGFVAGGPPMTGGIIPGGIIGGRVTGGLMGGIVTGGIVTGGFTMGGITGGRVTGGLMGGIVTGGIVTGGFTMGGIVTGGFTMGGIMGGIVTGGLMGGIVTGGLTMGGIVTGGFTMGGTVTGGLCFGLPQVPQPRIGEAEEMKSKQMRKRAWSLLDSAMSVCLWREKEREREWQSAAVVRKK